MKYLLSFAGIFLIVLNVHAQENINTPPIRKTDNVQSQPLHTPTVAAPNLVMKKVDESNVRVVKAHDTVPIKKMDQVQQVKPAQSPPSVPIKNAASGSGTTSAISAAQNQKKN